MMKRKLLVAAMVASLSTLTLVGCSNLGSVMQGVQGLSAAANLSGAPTTEAELAQAQKSIAADTKTVSAKILGAQTSLAQALDLKEMAANIEAQLKTVKRGNITADQLEKITTVSAQADEAINSRFEDVKELTDQQKEKVSESLNHYAGAALGTAKVAAKAAHTGLGLTEFLKNQMISNPSGLTDLKSKFGFLAEAGSSLPTFCADLISTGFSYVKLAKNYGIDTSAAEDQLLKAQEFMK